MRIQMSLCKKWLAVVWFSFAAILFFIMIVSTTIGHLQENSDGAWSWFLPSVMPTLSLMIAVLVADNQGTSKQPRTADKFLFSLSLGLSAFYLFSLFLVIGLQLYNSQYEVSLEVLKKSNLWLAPLQGLVAAALGAFFINREESK